MTEKEMGRVLAIYYGLASALELLNNYCEQHLAKDFEKEFHNPTEKYCYNNLHTQIEKSKHWFERYMKEAYKLECTKTDDDEEVKSLSEFERMDESIKTGIAYARYLLLFYNIVANAENLKLTLTKFESTIKLFIKKWFIPKEVIDEFKNFE